MRSAARVFLSIYNQTFNPNVPAGPGGWLQPTQVMTPRFFKFTAQFDF
jgi:hypothetical protein